MKERVLFKTGTYFLVIIFDQDNMMSSEIIQAWSTLQPGK